jgi:hypothetical protein
LNLVKSFDRKPAKRITKSGARFYGRVSVLRFVGFRKSGKMHRKTRTQRRPDAGFTLILIFNRFPAFASYKPESGTV